MTSIKWAGEYRGLILLTCIKFGPYISNHVSIIVWDGITNTFLNSTGRTSNINFDNCAFHPQALFNTNSDVDLLNFYDLTPQITVLRF